MVDKISGKSMGDIVGVFKADGYNISVETVNDANKILYYIYEFSKNGESYSMFSVSRV